MNGLILDVIVAVVAVLFLIFGIWRGMYKLVYGLISTVVALALAVFLTSLVSSLVINHTNIDNALFSALDAPLQGALPADLKASEVEIIYVTDADGKVTYSVSHGANVYESVNDYLKAEAPQYATVLNLLNLDSMLSNETTIKSMGADVAGTVNTTLAKILSTTASTYILYAIVFILLWIVLYIIMRLIMLVVKKFVHGTYIGHFLDKLLGMVVGAAFAMLIIWGALAIIRLLGTYTWIIPVNDLINDSTITKLLYENNILYNFLVNTANIQQALSGLLGNIGQKSENGEAARMIARVAGNGFSPKMI